MSLLRQLFVLNMKQAYCTNRVPCLGTPVISNDIGEVRSVLDAGGLGFGKKDTESYLSL